MRRENAICRASRENPASLANLANLAKAPLPEGVISLAMCSTANGSHMPQRLCDEEHLAKGLARCSTWPSTPSTVPGVSVHSVNVWWGVSDWTVSLKHAFTE